MKTHTGNLATLTGRVIILHGVNGAWLHEPKFGAGFAADIARRDPRAKLSYLKAWGSGPDDPRIFTHARRWLRDSPGVPDERRGLPLGWVFPHRLPGGAWLLHGVIQPYVRGTARPVGKDKRMEPDYKPAKLWAVRAVLENAVRFMRKRALAEGEAYELHCTRLGCGLGGLEWSDVRQRIESVERYVNAPIPDPRLVAAEVREGRRFRAEFNVWGRSAEEVAA